MKKKIPKPHYAAKLLSSWEQTFAHYELDALL